MMRTKTRGVTFALFFPLLILFTYSCGGTTGSCCPNRSFPTGPTPSIPEFPWPPPEASATADIPDHFFRPARDHLMQVRDIDAKLKGALDSSGYGERRYFAVPDGFAVVTRLESLNPDGTPKLAGDRWAAEVGPLRSFSLSDYLRALFTSDPGYFRIVTFIITPHPFAQGNKVSRGEAMAWLKQGLNKLPHEIAMQPYTEQYSCTALIYEFEKIRGEDAASQVVPGKLTGNEHLEKSKLWYGLQR